MFKGSESSLAIFFYLLPIRKKTARYNLDLCFPDKDHKWKNNIIKESYINLGINLLEFFYLPKFTRKKINEIVTL
ncbi:MAG: hypothetical protein IPL53_24355 [Ignavibacteria bacterium]|nr:hypothetical protein [Ignavibacteria bacterium]